MAVVVVVVVVVVVASTLRLQPLLRTCAAASGLRPTRNGFQTSLVKACSSGCKNGESPTSHPTNPGHPAMKFPMADALRKIIDGKVLRYRTPSTFDTGSCLVQPRVADNTTAAACGSCWDGCCSSGSSSPWLHAFVFASFWAWSGGCMGPSSCECA